MSRAIADAALRSASEVLASWCADASTSGRIAAAADALAGVARAGGTILACGNGGSCADAVHFCEELTGRFRGDRPPIGAVACADPGHLTCTANDYGFDQVFARWVRGLGRRGDALVLLSTSGNSANILRAAEAADELGLVTVALLGKDGGLLRGRCTHEIVVPGATADRIQELHMIALHTFVEIIERGAFPPR